MRATSPPENRAAEAAPPVWLLPAWLLGICAGAALQVLQPALWPGHVYTVLALGAALCIVARRPKWSPAARRSAAALAAAVLVFVLCGLRAGLFAAQALPPDLEGRDIRVTGVVAAMVQPVDAGVRLRLAVESATLGGAPVRLPPLIDLGWYAGGWGGAPQAAALPSLSLGLQPGERWALTVRLKAPHGERNPHGFDYELWLWEQGVQATGSVRAGARDAAPQRLARTWQYPVERLRQSVRDAIVERLATNASPASGIQVAGVIAALVTGDQRAIDLVSDNKSLRQKTIDLYGFPVFS